MIDAGSNGLSTAILDMAKRLSIATPMSFDDAMGYIHNAYAHLIAMGIPAEDAARETLNYFTKREANND